ncbi:hypothetical protein BWZ22_14735 [Seonamhaeicola sp. S2-3]|uniref:serine O-acetyltransferase n=1 Tax=Seonamhaeicola sp. S2-3 TaxID=1936081 RepID=UPI000972B405|nr:hypothetical protein [Seonamhaeicola sp. S2-3]APY12402.1 hypothetical protein BWZ22_14735 [Seonamhaeicola sp. S2-3]
MRTILFYIYRVLLIPHVVLYLFSTNKETISKDLDRWCVAKSIKGSKINSLLYLLCHSKDFRTIFYFRINNPIKHLFKLYCKGEQNFTIDVNTKLGGGILTGHPYCTILNAKSIGENFYVNHLVTVGEIDGKKPTIGNNVSIFTGAIVIGDIVIGDNAKIGAGAVVVKNVPENATVVGNPAKIINK